MMMTMKIRFCCHRRVHDAAKMHRRDAATVGVIRARRRRPRLVRGAIDIETVRSVIVHGCICICVPL